MSRRARKQARRASRVAYPDPQLTKAVLLVGAGVLLAPIVIMLLWWGGGGRLDIVHPYLKCRYKDLFEQLDSLLSAGEKRVGRRLSNGYALALLLALLHGLLMLCGSAKAESLPPGFLSSIAAQACALFGGLSVLFSLLACVVALFLRSNYCRLMQAVALAASAPLWLVWALQSSIWLAFGYALYVYL